MHVASTERMAFLGQAGAHLTEVSEALHRELDELDRTMIGLPVDAPLRQRVQMNQVAIAACQEDLRAASAMVLQAIESHEAAVRTDEAMFRKRVVEIETLVQDITGTVTSLLDFLGGPECQGSTRHPSFQIRLAQDIVDIVTMIRSFAVIGGAYSRMAGLRMVATVMEGVAAIVESLDVAQPGQTAESRSAVTAAIARVQNSGMVRQQELDAAKVLLAAVDRLDYTLGAAV
jgi:hypothetical protein